MGNKKILGSETEKSRQNILGSDRETKSWDITSGRDSGENNYSGKQNILECINIPGI